MESKTIDAACIGYAEEVLPCERELQDLGEYSACTVVAHSIGVDDKGDLLGTMLISFGPMYHKSRKLTYAEVKYLADVINDVLERRAVDTENDDDDECDECDECEARDSCDACIGSKMDITEDDVAKLGEELKGAIEDFSKLLDALRKNR